MSTYSYKAFPYGLQFYWYVSNRGEEHREAWGQLCGSMHRLVFLREEFENFKVSDDMDYTLDRLSYHMENYLVRVYELRERLVKLLHYLSGHQGKMDELKWKETRNDVVGSLNISETTAMVYLRLLSALDADIALRNLNTHNTSLSLGFSTGADIYNPHDIMLDLDRDLKAKNRFKKLLRKEIKRIIAEHVKQIEEIRMLTESCLREMDFTGVPRETPNEPVQPIADEAGSG